MCLEMSNRICASSSQSCPCSWLLLNELNMAESRSLCRRGESGQWGFTAGGTTYLCCMCSREGVSCSPVCLFTQNDVQNCSHAEANTASRTQQGFVFVNGGTLYCTEPRQVGHAQCAEAVWWHTFSVFTQSQAHGVQDHE